MLTKEEQRRKKYPTLKEISKLVGVDVSTVSRILNDTGGKYSEKTKRKILQTAKKLGYQPNIIARGLKNQKTTLIGVILPTLPISFYAHILQGIEDKADEENYSIITQTSHYKSGKEKQYLNVFFDKKVDGIILHPAIDNPNISLIKNLHETYNIPIVFVVHNLNISNIPYVSVDHHYGAILATEHLIRLGHKKIAHIAGRKNEPISEARKKGYIDTIKKHNLNIPQNYLVYTDTQVSSAYEATKKILALKNRPTAIFAYSDHLALGVKLATAELGINVPNDLALIGFDDMDFCDMLDVPLTTISQPKHQLGYLAAQKLFNMIEGNKEESILLKPKLVVRKSCGAYKLAGFSENTVSFGQNFKEDVL